MAKKKEPFKDSLGKRDTVKNMMLAKMTVSQICLAIGCTRAELSEHYEDLVTKYQPVEHIPTEEDRSFVWRCAAIGVPPSEISNKLGISTIALNRNYPNELRNGKAEWTDRLHNSLYTQALGGNHQAAMFLLKTKGGFKETQVNEHTGADGVPLGAVINLTVGGQPVAKEN